MHTSIPFNAGWKFKPSFLKAYLAHTFDDSQWETVELPHTNVGFEPQYHQEEVHGFLSTYRNRCEVELEKGMRLSLTFDGIANKASFYVDGELMETHQGGFLPVSLELGERRNFQLVVVVDSSLNVDVPPFGGSLDYLCFGGIYRRATLHRYHSHRLGFIRVVSDDPCSVQVHYEVVQPSDLSLELRLLDGEHVLSTQVLQNPGENGLVVFDSLSLQVWQPDQPTLYSLSLRLGDQDERTITFGCRSACFKAEGFFLNGNMVKLIGLNRHQDYPYIGYAAPPSLQFDDALALKRLGVNLVRTSHYPQDPSFLDACDQLGIMVFEEVPGWQHIGASLGWREACVSMVQEMVLRDVNHPSIILWGVRINESADDDELYEQTNAACRILDPTRQTGGVRNVAHSHLIEDVYTFNDFSHDGTNSPLKKKSEICSPQVPYLVTEFCGHTYPAKPFDHPSVRTEQALRHARVLDAALQPGNGMCGAVGWCMHDYHTHANFGSGDQICYHGVQDLGRGDKLSSYVYKSQLEGEPILVCSSSFDGGDNPNALLDDTVVFTNCECVLLRCDGKEVGTFHPDRRQFPHLAHPPIFIDDMIGKRLEEEAYLSPSTRNRLKKLLKKVGSQNGNLRLLDKLQMGIFLWRYHLGFGDAVNLFSTYVGNWGSEARAWTVEGLVGGKVVASETYAKGLQARLTLQTESTTIPLDSDGYSVIRVGVEIRMEGRTLPLAYAQTPFSARATGSLRMWSPPLSGCIGGRGTIYLCTLGIKGGANLEVHSPLGDKTLLFTVV